MSNSDTIISILVQNFDSNVHNSHKKKHVKTDISIYSNLFKHGFTLLKMEEDITLSFTLERSASHCTHLVAPVSGVRLKI